jgi:hypothetical protein
MSTIVEVMIPHPGGTRPLRKVWRVDVDTRSDVESKADGSQHYVRGHTTTWEFTCIRNAEDFVKKGSACARHDDSLGMCPRCKGKIL